MNSAAASVSWATPNPPECAGELVYFGRAAGEKPGDVPVALADDGPRRIMVESHAFGS